jgi:hypothetical protein
MPGAGNVGGIVFWYFCWGVSAGVFAVIGFGCFGAWIVSPSTTHVISTQTNSTLTDKKIININNYQVQLEFTIPTQTPIKCLILTQQFTNAQDATITYNQYHVYDALLVNYYFNNDMNMFVCSFTPMKENVKNVGPTFIAALVFLCLSLVMIILFIHAHMTFAYGGGRSSCYDECV